MSKFTDPLPPWKFICPKCGEDKGPLSASNPHNCPGPKQPRKRCSNRDCRNVVEFDDDDRCPWCREDK